MLSFDNKNGTLTVRLKGDIDNVNAPIHRISIDKLIKDDNFIKFVFDLSEVTFMDSTAVGLIMGRYKNLKQKKKPVYFSSPSKVADKVLKVSGLYTIIPKI